MPLKFSIPNKDTKEKISSSNNVVKTGTLNNAHYSPSSTANIPITKNAQFAGSAANVTMAQPMFFSPLHTPQNWQIASKRREVYMWSFISPCNITDYDGSIKDISKIYEEVGKDRGENEIFDLDVPHKLLNGNGEFEFPDKISKRYVSKKANKIGIMGVAEPLIVTSDHHCRVVKREDVLCKYHKKKNCTPFDSPTCQRHHCNKHISDYKISEIFASDIEPGDFVLVPFPTKIKESCIKTESDARYAGHLASDGWYCNGANKSGYTVAGICMNTEEKEYVLPCIKEVYKSRNCNLNLLEENQNSTLLVNRTSDKTITNFASRIISSKGSTKKFTEEILFLDPILQKHVLGAYIQSDGCYNKQNDVYEITTYSKHLANQLLLMFYRCGILARINKQPISSAKTTYKSNNKFRYILNISSSECEKISEYVPGKPQTNKRKKGSSWRFFWKNYVVSRVSSNQSFDYKGPVYDIRVPPTYTVTVNGVSVFQSRFYYENEPKIAAGVDFYSNFSMNGFTLECSNKKVLKYYEKLVKDLKLNHWLKLISHEYFMIGDVFPFTEIECSVCKGAGLKPDGEPCNHPGGTIKRLVVLNPDWIEVQSNVLASEPSITLVPDEELRQIVSKKDPIQIYRRLPKKLIDMVSMGRPIPLSNRCVSHIKHNASPYGTYGTSLLRRLFTILAYKTKLMTANWIVAERLILPVRVIKIGDKERPATAADIMDVSNQITAVANDPNLTLVTHHAFDYEWYGACNSSDTKALCKSGGWKNYWEIKEDDEIMVFDPDTNEMRYEKPEALHVYDFNNYMVEFEGNKIDMCVTPNHKMLGYKRDKKTAYTMEARDLAKIAGNKNTHVRCVADYISDQDIESVHIAGHDIDIESFLKFAGYYVAEGYSIFDTGKRAYRVSFSQSPEKNIENCNEIDGIMEEMGVKYHKYAYAGRVTTWDILIKDVVEVIKEWFGSNSNNKRIPQFIKNLPPNKLKMFIDAYCNGDASRYIYKTTEAVQCGTNSEDLANDLIEIMFKAGYAPILSPYKKGKQFVVNCNLTNTGKGRFPRIKKEHVNSKYYKGKVWCYTTSTGFFVTMRNGKIAIQGNTGKIHNITAELEQIGKEILDGLMLNQALLNGEMSSYSSAQVGVETMIRRLESWRTTLSEWVENHIFLPVAMMQGFINEKDSEELDETAYLYPKLKWEDLNLRDKSGHLQLMMQLHDKQLISSQKLLQEFDVDYDQEVERLREEQVTAGPQGQMPGGAPGGMMGGMGDMGGMGGAPPMPDGLGGAGMPGMDGGMAPGGMPGMDGGMGGAPGGAPMAPGAAGGMGPSANMLPPNFKIGKKGHGGKGLDEQMKPPAPRFIKLTTLEQKLYKIIQGSDISQQLYLQYAVQPTGENQPFVMDFAYPALGVGIEADGKAWHENVDSKIRDNQRDQKLANIGWRILRFKEDAIQQQPDAIKSIIDQQIAAASADQKKRFKKKSSGSEVEKIANILTFENLTKDNIIYNKIQLEDNLGCLYLIGQ